MRQKRKHSSPREEAENFVGMVERMLSRKEDLIYGVDTWKNDDFDADKPLAEKLLAGISAGVCEVTVSIGITGYNVSKASDIFALDEAAHLGAEGAEVIPHNDGSNPEVEVYATFEYE